MSALGEHKESNDYGARSLASEAIQALRSHDALDTLRFENMEQQYQDIKNLIAETNKKIDQGFKSYDSKFWTLATSIIFLLVGGISCLIFYMITHGINNG